MRELFPEFSPSTPEWLQRLMQQSTVVLDANVLLSLYRYSANDRDKALRVLASPAVRNRLRLPYQAGLEFLHSRLSVADELETAYKHAISTVRKLPDEALRKFGSGDQHRQSRERVREQITEITEELADGLRAILNADEARIDGVHDPLLDRIDELLVGQVEQPVRSDVVRQRVREFSEYRAPMSIPPGFRDARKDVLGGAGDYLIWCEILDYAESSAGPVLFVTNDTKNDWYEQERDQHAGPRRELVREFAERSPHGYHQVDFERFLDLSKTHLDLRVDKRTVDDAISAAKADKRQERLEAERDSARQTAIQRRLQRAAGRRIWEEMVDVLRPSDLDTLRHTLANLEPAEPAANHPIDPSRGSVIDALLEALGQSDEDLENEE